MRMKASEMTRLTAIPSWAERTEKAVRMLPKIVAKSRTSSSFFSLSSASRYTQAANVSLLMLLETVLGPLWVWLGLGEAPTPRMLAGGAIVIVSLALYILTPRLLRRAPRRRPA